MRRLWTVFVCLFLLGLSVNGYLHDDSQKYSLTTTENYPTDSSQLSIDMKSWPLMPGDYLEAEGLGEQIRQDMEQDFHGNAILNEDFFQILVLPDAHCEIENIVDSCHVTQTTMRYNVTVTHSYGQLTIDYVSVETSYINPNFSLMLSHVAMYDQIWDYHDYEDNHQYEYYEQYWANETYVKRTTGNPDTIAVGDTWSEFVHSNGTIVSTSDYGYSDHDDDGHDDHDDHGDDHDDHGDDHGDDHDDHDHDDHGDGHDDHGDDHDDGHNDHDDEGHDDSGHDGTETWEEWENYTYRVTDIVTIELPPNLAGENNNNTQLEVLAVETIDESGEVQTTEVVSDYFKHKIFNFPVEAHLVDYSDDSSQNQTNEEEDNQNNNTEQGQVNPDCDDEYLLYNHHEHISYTQQEVIDGESENWYFLDPNDFPDYNHPAYYYMLTHQVLDCTQNSTVGGNWTLVSEDYDPDDCDCPDKYHQMMIQYPDSTSRVVYYRHEDLDDTRTAWDLTFQSLTDQGADLRYENTDFGVYVTGIDGVNIPSDNEWWWELHLWNETSGQWVVSDVGADSVILNDDDHIAWVASNSDYSSIPIPADDYNPGDPHQFTITSFYIMGMVDDDKDGVANQFDDCPNGMTGWSSNPNTDFDNDGCLDDGEDNDDDNDGHLDSYEVLCLSNPKDSTSIPINSDNTGECDALDDDDDDDGHPDYSDAFPYDPSEHIDTDQDGIGNNADLDDDGDNYSDSYELSCLSDPLSELSIPDNADDDNLCDNLDLDDDNDGFPDVNDAFPIDENEWFDTDSDGLGDNSDADDDGDGFSDEIELSCSSDQKDALSMPADSDGDGDCNSLDLDDDNDSWNDIEETRCAKDPFSSISFPIDTDADGICDYLDEDLDGDGVNNTMDAFPQNPDESLDSDGDGVGDNADAYPNNPAANVAGELDEKFNVTLVLAITSLVIIILGTALYVIRRNPADDIDDNANQLNYQPEQHQFVDDNGHHWLRQADGTLYWWNGQTWQKMQ